MPRESGSKSRIPAIGHNLTNTGLRTVFLQARSPLSHVFQWVDRTLMAGSYGLSRVCPRRAMCQRVHREMRSCAPAWRSLLRCLMTCSRIFIQPRPGPIWRCAAAEPWTARGELPGFDREEGLVTPSGKRRSIGTFEPIMLRGRPPLSPLFLPGRRMQGKLARGAILLLRGRVPGDGVARQLACLPQPA